MGTAHLALELIEASKEGNLARVMSCFVLGQIRTHNMSSPGQLRCKLPQLKGTFGLPKPWWRRARIATKLLVMFRPPPWRSQSVLGSPG